MNRPRGRRDWPEYNIWNSMIDRCHRPANKEYKNYGGRGIFVCDEWRGRGGFARFIEHVRRRPDPSFCIDRIDNDRGYEPGNVKWSTISENIRNQRRTIRVELWGVKVPLRDIADTFEIPMKTIESRMERRGLSWQDAIRWKKSAHSLVAGLADSPDGIATRL